MRAPARLRLDASLAGVLLCAPWLAAGCGDDASASTDAGSSTTSGDTSSTGLPDASSTTAASAEGSDDSTSSTDDTDDSTTGGSTTTGSSGTQGGSDSSSGDTTGAQAVDVPFTVLDPSVLELSARVPEGWVVITTADAWASFTDAPVPPGVTFPAQWVMLGSRGPQPYPGHALTVQALSWQGDTLTVTGDQVDPADDCETYAFIWPADTLLAFDALGAEIEDIDDQTAPLEASCAGGATDSMPCDLASPCATGLLCAGIIRNTVLANDPGGLCLDSGFSGVFSGAGAAIPADGGAIELAVDVGGLATVDMDVTVLLDLDHPAPEELVIELRNPDGNQVPVANLQSTELHPGGVPIVPTGFSGDESVNGTWTLVVRDAVDNGSSGSISGWELEIMSRLD